MVHKLATYFLRALAVISGIPIPIFTAQFMWTGLDGRTGWDWWLYLWAFVMTTAAAVFLAFCIAWGIWPRTRKPEPRIIEYPEPKTPEQALSQTLMRQHEILSDYLRHSC